MELRFQNKNKTYRYVVGKSEVAIYGLKKGSLKYPAKGVIGKFVFKEAQKRKLLASLPPLRYSTKSGLNLFFLRGGNLTRLDKNRKKGIHSVSMDTKFGQEILSLILRNGVPINVKKEKYAVMYGAGPLLAGKL